MATLDDDKLRVLEASDIAQVIGEYVKLVPKGREFPCLCPFHDDRNPSMYVVPHKRMFHCFVCGAGGDVFTFVQKYHGIGFGEALKMLAERAGIELTRRRPEERERSGPSRSDLIDANRAAQAFFRAILEKHDSGAAARALVDKRGISPEMIDRFAIGASPDRWDGLLTFARTKRLSEQTLLSLGLLKQKEREPYDALRNRLIFPIHGETGDPIAFGGRRVDDEDEPKYLNSPETPLFNKSKTLFGLPQARDAIRRSGRAVIVEGYTDVVACHQAGLANVVGTLGTAFTEGHAQKLRGQCQEVVLLFDGDEAGQNAADRALSVLFGSRLDIRVAMLTGQTAAKDPDELLKSRGGAEVLAGVLDDAEPVIDRWARRIREKQAQMGPAGRARYLEEQVERLADTGLESLAPIERESMLGDMAQALGVPGRLVADAYQRARTRGRRAGDADPGAVEFKPGAIRPIDRFRVHAIACLLEPSVFSSADRARTASALLIDLEACPEALAAIVRAASDAVRAGEPLEAGTLLAMAPGERLARVLAEAFASTGDADAEELDACLGRLEEHGLRHIPRDAGAGVEAGDRLARLRSLHSDFGGNRAANPYRRGGGIVRAGAGQEGVRTEEREAGASPPPNDGSVDQRRSDDGQER